MSLTKSLFGILVLLLAILQSVHAEPTDVVKASKTKIFLHQGWQFREAGKDAWHKAEVPGCVHTDLMSNGLIEDPFYRNNEQKLQWIGKTD